MEIEELHLDPFLRSLEEMIVNNQWNEIYFIENEEDPNFDEDINLFGKQDISGL